ncbi:patatin-like phospholipase family protein [Caulobacter segnis]|uniref:patatin-like phospholipase family protein n=1 Tax=Caulobacter segnis TaxID=88688 RepID=UPI0028589E7D|nr:patatin-like phospholipase family protein [Caulobacter segnis]MDR6625841.1 NTE family protein [Caulobacter segnis]
MKPDGFGRAGGSRRTVPFDRVALVLQGGGALGAYQAGVYEGLAQASLHPNWVAGISIGAINAALIAGSAPEARVEKLRAFWRTVTSDPWTDWLATPSQLGGDLVRHWSNQWHAVAAVMRGAEGFFSPRLVPAYAAATGTADAISFYDTSSLRTTLERLVDFDRINSGEMRFSVGAVNVATGNLIYFDNRTHEIRPEHIIASGALPPAFAPVEIEGEYYWDGGVVSNTPLQWVVESAERQDTLAFQVDLWSARGAIPRSLPEVMTRQKEIQYSSRTRARSDQFRKEQKLRSALTELISKMPEHLRDTPEYALLAPESDRKVYSIIQLIYQSHRTEGGSKDFEFSARSMDDHWAAGLSDTIRTLRHPEVLERPTTADGVFTFDIATNGRLS